MGQSQSCFEGLTEFVEKNGLKKKFTVRYIWFAKFNDDHPYKTPEKKKELVDATCKALSGDDAMAKCSWDLVLPAKQQGRMDFCLTVDFTNTDACIKHMNDPEHYEFAKKYFIPYSHSSTYVQVDI